MEKWEILRERVNISFLRIFLKSEKVPSNCMLGLATADPFTRPTAQLDINSHVKAKKVFQSYREQKANVARLFLAGSFSWSTDWNILKLMWGSRLEIDSNRMVANIFIDASLSSH